MLKRWETWFLVFIWIAIATMAGVGFNFIKPAHATIITAPLTVQCFNGDYVVIEKAFKKWDEIAILTGVMRGNKDTAYIFVNKDTGAWSFVLLGIEDVYCIVFTGEGLKPVKRKDHAQTH